METGTFKTFETFDGEMISGFIVNRGYELPKNAKLSNCKYDKNFKYTINIYRTAKKTYLRLSKI